MNTPLSLLAAALALLVLVALGRGVERHTTPPGQPPMFATSLLAGMGLWTLLWLAFVPTGGGHTPVLVPLMVLLTLALAGNYLRRWARDKSAEEHFWSLPITHTLLLAPWLPLLWAAGPATLADFSSLHTLTTLATQGGWPTGGNSPFGGGTPGWHIIHLLPAMATASAGQATIPATWLASVVAVLGAASLVPAFTNTPVKWSNLPLVAAPGLLITLALFPLFMPLSSTTPNLLLAPLALAVAALPLLRSGLLAVGWATLPHALALAWLATLHPLGLPAAMVVAFAWVGLSLWKHGPKPGLLLTATLLLALPLIAILMLAKALWPWHGLTFANVPALMNSLTALIPWPVQGPWWLNLLQLLSLSLLAIPLRVGAFLYAKSPLARATYAHPWFYALPLLAGALAAGLALRPMVAVPPAPVIPYAQDVAADLTLKRLVPPGQPLAVVGLPAVAAAALQYHLPMVPVRMVSESMPVSAFHATLRRQGYARVWMGPQAAQTLFRLPQPPSASLFVDVGEAGLSIRAIYPMPQAR